MSDHAITQTSITAWADHLEATTSYPPGVPAPGVKVYRQTASTQDIARRHAGEWLVALAEEQTAGRGRLGRAWVAPPGTAVLMSLAWPGVGAKDTLDTIAYRIAVAVAKSAEPLLSGTPHRIAIKWPNDILVDGRKLAGILIERAGDAAIIGIGFNVTLDTHDLSGLPDELAARVTSLTMLGRPTDRLRVAAALIGQCYLHLDSPHETLLLDEWRRRSPLGYDARFRCDGEDIAGTVIDLDPALGLIVRRDSGEIVHLPAATTTVLP